jgi:hypothetical protein
LSILTDENQKKLEALLVSEGLVKEDLLNQYRKQASAIGGKPLFALLAENKVVGNEDLTRLIAQVSGVPYVDLSISWPCHSAKSKTVWQSPCLTPTMCKPLII